MSIEALLDVQNIGISYGAATAVRSATMQVRKGELVAVIGNNGAGKTSILRGISGLVRPSSGQVLFKGRDITAMPAHEKVKLGLALIPESRMIFSDQTVEDNLILGAYSRWRAERQAVQAEIEELMEIFPRLRARYQQTAGSLSGGEQQMLAIARGLLSKPELLMVDELSLGLAPLIVEQLMEVLQTLNRKGLTILLVEQLAAHALSIADRAYVVSSGQTTMTGSAEEFFQDEKIMEAFLGVRKPAVSGQNIEKGD